MLRATTNLIVDPTLQLDRKQLRSGFLYVYNKGYTGLEPVFINKLWMASFMPDIPQAPNFGKNRKGIRAWSEYQTKNTLAGLLTLKKVNDPNDPHFVASIPLATFNRYEAAIAHRRYSLWFTDGKAGSDDDNQTADSLDRELRDTSNDPNAIVHRQIPGAQAIANAKFDARASAELGETLISIGLKYKGGMAVVVADFKIPAPVAQQLTTTEWMLIRNIDLYPLLMQWVVGQFGYVTSAPLASFPVSKIAKTLPKVEKGDARVNDDGLTIDPRGVPMWLPKELDNTSRYEDQFTQAGDRGDGTFSLLDMSAVGTLDDPMKAVTRLPPNIPVLIDWVNKKFSYTQSNGILKVQDLSRFKAADASHIHTLLQRLYAEEKQIVAISHIAGAAGVEPVIKFNGDELAAISNDDPITAEKFSSGWIPLKTYWELAVSFAQRFVTEDNPIYLDDLAIDGHPIFRPFGRWAKQALASCLNNIDSINTKYSVSGVSNALGTLTLLKYAGSETIRLEANKLKSAASNQNVDPNWEPPSIPMLGSEDHPIGMLPHQKKVRNLMKDSPDFAILPVQAGGGKSVLTITDVLYEIKANRSQPYLILCPPHLVAQYVKEIVFFTGGKLNVVPINTNSILRNGFERLTQMMESAPRNTVVVCDYDVLRGRQRTVCYGTTNVTVYPVIEFLRQFRFGYCMLDESHSVKNDSQRTRACMVLISDIPKKRLASGTMAHDSPSDLALQIAMLDPTLFGSKAEFNERFGAEVKGDRVVSWKPGAQQEIMKVIKSRVVVAGAMRKEWAALLPTAEEQFLGVELTDAQHSVYQAILTEALDKMREDAKTNKSLQKFFAAKGEVVVGDDDLDEEEEAADENAGADLESLLGFYLARLEQFITAPARDELGDKVLKGDDRISPKVTQIIKQIRLHISQNIPGKVLVFTNYTDSAEEIFALFPDDIKKLALLYVAAEKTETGAAFENDDRYKVMVGVENSMNTGLNLQFVSRLIRTETVWNPGTLEQGNSRVNRPELKKADRRDKIYYDWIVANRTYDITKISRLISKVIAVAKFENTDNPAYEDIPDVPVIKMSAEAIQEFNDWTTNLTPYGEAYRDYKNVQKEDYAEYRAKHGNLKLEPLEVAPTPKDAKLMAEVPYTPGLELFDAGKLGLVRVDEYLRLDSNAQEEDEADDGDEDEGGMTESQKAKKRMADLLVGQPVHTEWGDGIIKNVRMKGKRLNVKLNEGGLIRAPMAASFVKTNPKLKFPNVREALLKGIDPKMQVTEKVTAISPIMRIDKVAQRQMLKQRELDEKQKQKAPGKVPKGPVKAPKADINIELYLNVSNGFLGLTYFVEDDAAKSAVQALGFRPVPPHVLAEMKNSLMLKRLFAAWEQKGFTLDKKFREMSVSNAIHDMYLMLKNGSLNKGAATFNFSSRNNLKNFFREESKPSASKNEFKPYPMIEDGKAYIVMHTRGQPAAARAIKVNVPGVKWQQGAESMVYYGLDLAQTGQKIKEIMAAGIQIANIKDLQRQFKAARKTKIRQGDE